MTNYNEALKEYVEKEKQKYLGVVIGELKHSAFSFGLEKGINNGVSKCESLLIPMLAECLDTLEQTVDEAKRDYKFKGKTASECLNNIKTKIGVEK